MALDTEKVSTKIRSRLEDRGFLLDKSYLVFVRVVGAGSRDGSWAMKADVMVVLWLGKGVGAGGSVGHPGGGGAKASTPRLSTLALSTGRLLFPDCDSVLSVVIWHLLPFSSPSLLDRWLSNTPWQHDEPVGLKLASSQIYRGNNKSQCRRRSRSGRSSANHRTLPVRPPLPAPKRHPPV